jgi:hypothetical protein
MHSPKSCGGFSLAPSEGQVWVLLGVVYSAVLSVSLITLTFLLPIEVVGLGGVHLALDRP